MSPKHLSESEPVTDIKLDNLTSYTPSLLNRFTSPSKYLHYWEHLKTHRELIIKDVPDIAGKHEAIKKGIRNLRRQDNYFIEYCILTYGYNLAINSVSLDNNTIQVLLYKPNDKISTKFI
jgi:hypothetical protein